MTWATHPLFKLPKSTEKVTTDIEGAQADNRGSASPGPSPRKGDESGFKPPSNKLTGHQFFYIFILDGVGAAIVSAGINFAIAYALYYNKGDDDSPIRLFQFPNTLAGDAGLTTIVQCLITWFVEALLVNRDLRKGAVQSIGFLPKPRWKFLRWFMFLDRQEQTHEVRSIEHWLRFLFSQVIRSLIMAAVFFPFIWGPSIGFLILAGDYVDGDWYYSAKWAPQIFKLAQGAVLGLLSTPLMVVFWLTRCGWALKKDEEQSIEE
ncbi:hypothetical protein F5Y19DRAFT_236301 [Xylariaceae sp. FL1651]|nr:hypothetical protein F5Y19DRAFT_236301 [Xylariaceae sp. FL1651]